jgi:putative membrane protein
MRVTRRLVSLLALATLVALPASLPALAQSGTAERIVHRQSVRTDMTPSGEVEEARIFTQLTVVGDGEVEVVLPSQSTQGLRNLEGFGRPSVEGDQVVHTVTATADGGFERTVAENTATLPIELGVEYRLDGEPIEPSDLVGRSGQLTASFTVRNTTAEPTEVQYFDGQGARQTETIDVAVPIVGSLSMELDGRFVDIDAPAAAVAGNGRGDTRISWSLVLFEPVGSEEQTVSYTAYVSDAIVPEVTGQFLPVDSNSFTSLESVQETFGQVAEGLRSLTTGALIVDGNVKLLAAGTAQLLDGLGQLSDGADQLAVGLNERAAPGSQQLADGTGQARDGSRQLADGLLELEDGAGQLSAGLGQASGGASELADGLDLLADGSGRLRSGSSQLAAGASQLDTSAGELAAGAQLVGTGATGLLGGLQLLKASINDPEALPAAIAGIELLRGAVAGMQQGIGSATTPETLLNGLARLGGGLSNPACDLGNPRDPANPCGVLQVLGLLRAGIGPSSTPGTLLYGVARIEGGLNNPACNPANPTDPANPCGIKQGAGAIAAGAGELSSQAAGARTTLEAIDQSALGPVDQARLNGVIQGIGDAGTPDTLLNGLARIQAGANGISAGADALIAGLGDAETEATLRYGLAQLDAGLQSLEGAVGSPAAAGTLLNGVARITGGLSNPACDPEDPRNPANPCGILQVLGLVDAGLVDLGDGLEGALDSLNAGLGSTSDGPTDSLIGGANALAGGAGQVASGASRLQAEGTTPLAAGAGELSTGAGQLAAGAGAAADGGQALESGLGQLDDGGQRLAAGANTAASGANDLANGLVQIDDGANELADGLQDAADGSQQLADGLESAEEGGEQIAEGTQALTDRGMSQLIDGASEGAKSPALAVAHAKAADARGKAGDGLPYGTVPGAEATAVYQFELAGLGGPEEGPSTPVRAAATIVAFGIAGAVGLGLRRTLV